MYLVDYLTYVTHTSQVNHSPLVQACETLFCDLQTLLAKSKYTIWMPKIAFN